MEVWEILFQWKHSYLPSYYMITLLFFPLRLRMYKSSSFPLHRLVVSLSKSDDSVNKFWDLALKYSKIDSDAIFLPRSKLLYWTDDNNEKWKQLAFIKRRVIKLLSPVDLTEVGEYVSQHSTRQTIAHFECRFDLNLNSMIRMPYFCLGQNFYSELTTIMRNENNSLLFLFPRGF
jgi:hypothetical protein